MSKTIDEKVVEMRFDNKQFEKGTAETMSTLDKLKQKLNLTGASKGLEEVNTAANKVNMSGMASAIDNVRSKFSTLEVMGITALANITNSAVNAGKRIASALTIDPIKTGFSEYETQINAVQTILANTESKGTTLQDVNRALDELNTYADKTIYNFTEMTRNIGTFTAAGVDLKTSVSAIQGIANLAAVSGSTSQQASTAMYQLSQALSSGTVKLMDWNSVVNAGMGGQVFQDALKATARVHGVNVDAMIKKNGSFRESLQEGWITSEILTETLNKFTMAAEEGSEQWKTYKKSLMDEGYTSKQAEDILKMANTATDAATKVKTFTQLWDTLKESAQSGWTQTWEIIIGDFGEAKEFLTTISDTIGGMLGASADARNTLLSGALSSGWKQLLGAGIADEEGYKETLQKVAKKNGFEFDKMIKETEKKGGDYDDALKQALSEGKINSDMLSESVTELSKKMQKMSAEERAAAGYTQDHVQQIKELEKGLKDGTISMDEFVKKMTRPSGRENLIQSLTNSFNGLMNIVKPIKEAFREIFPPTTSEQLYNLTVRIKEITGNFAEFTEKHGPQIKSTFKGIFSVIDIGVTFLKEFASGVGRLLSNFTGITGGVLGATASLGDWLTNLRDSVKESNIFGKTIDGIVGFLQKGINAIKGFTKYIAERFAMPGYEGFLGVLKAIFDMIVKVGSKIGKVLSDVIRSDGLVAGLDVLNTGLFSGILLGINKFVNNLSGSFENISDVLDSLKGILEAYQQDLQAKTLLKIASAIGILAVSLLLLASIKPERMTNAIVALSVLFLELLGSLKLFTKISPDMKNVMRASTALIALSSAMLILSVAMKIMSTMSWEEMGVGLISTVVGLGALVGAVNLLPEKKVTKAASAIKKMCTGLLILSVAMKIMATMSWEEIGKGLTVTVVGLGALVGAVNLLPKDTGLRALGMISLATSLVVLAGAMKLMATMSWEEIGKGVTVTAAGLAAMVLAIRLLPKSTALKAAGMMVMATSLVVLAGAMKILGSMQWDEIWRGLTAMGLALLELVIAVNLMKGALAGAGALLVTSAAIIILATSLKIIGSMSWESIIKGLVGIAGAFILIGLAGHFLTPLVPTLLGLAGAFALFGVGTVAIGAGLTLIAAGITALGIALAGGATAIVAGLSAIIMGVLGLIPEIVKILGEAIVVLCQVIIECAPLIADTILIVIAEVFASLAKYTPQIVASLLQFLIGVINSLADNLPALIMAVMNLVGALFKGVIDALKSVDPDTLLKGVAGLGLLTGLMYMLAGVAALTPMAMLGVLGLGLVIAELALVLAAIGKLSQIPGLTWLVEQGGNLMQAVGTAIGQFIGGIIGGIASGISSSLPQVATNLSQFMVNLMPFIDGVKMVDMSIIGKVAALSGAIALLSAANFVANISSFLGLGSSFSELGAELSKFMVNAGGFIAGAAMINPSMMDGVKTLAEAVLVLTAADLLQGITSWLTGGSSLADFGSQLGGLGTNLNEFVTNLGTFSEEQVTTVDCAGRAIKALAEAAKGIPNEGGLWGAIAGENSLATFGGYLPGVGTNIKDFVTNLGTFSEEQVTTVDCAGRAIKALAEAAKEIPNDGGLWGAIAGENSLATFGCYLPSLGKNLSSFVTNLGTFADDQVTTVDCAGRAIKALAEAAKEIPNEGGLWASIVGDNSLATFGSYLPDLGKNLNSFVTNLGTFSEAQVTTVECACAAITGLANAAKNIPNEGGMWAKIFGDNSLATFGEKLPGVAKNIKGFVSELGEFSSAQVDTVYSATDVIYAVSQLGHIDLSNTGDNLESFGNNMVKFAKKVKDFIKHMGEASGESITTAVNKTKELIDMASTVASTNIDSIKTFGDSLKKVAEDGVKGFVNAFSGDSPKTEAANAVKAMLDSLINGAEEKKTTVEDKSKSIAEAALKALFNITIETKAKQAGKDLVAGFANGIKNNKYLASDAGSTIGRAALSAAKEAIDAHSPSREAMKIGNYFGEGLIIGIDEYGSQTYDAGYSIADRAKSGLSKAISKVSDLINSDIDSQPTIRPVLDLSDVESGVGHLSSMFNNGPSLAVATNLGAISYGMNTRNQNGINDDVISALDKLGKNLSNSGGDTYNINGITYDDGSNISEAVKAIARAATVGRRV